MTLMQNIPTVSMAVSIVLRLLLEMVTLASHRAGPSDVATNAKVALRIYASLYTSACDALLNITRMPGPFCLETIQQQTATKELQRYLSKLIGEAEVNGIRLSYGESFSGVTDSPRAKWLPAIQTGESVYKSKCVLLSLPLMMSLDGEGDDHHRALSITAWRNLFMSKFPLLLFERYSLVC
jgi:hypothetical protein